MLAPASVLATRLDPALSDRTWAIEDEARCQMFFALGGRAVWTAAQSAPVEVGGPAMLWLPHSARGRWRVLAGGDGFAASISLDFVQRTVGDAALTVHLRPLLDGVVLAGAEALATEAAALSVSFASLVAESSGSRPGAGAMLGLHLSTLLMRLWRCVEPHPATDPRAAGATTAQRFRRLVELHYREGLRIDAFAARLGVTRAHLHDACLRAFDRTPLALLHDRLLAEARLRLEQTDLSVEQIGYGIGFRDPGYFNRFFKRMEGQTPGAYRRSLTAGQLVPSVTSYAAWP